mmetsp:Transcript_75882/g.212065  ORF Transcript_75882/g.212065 Transcript_75882/m.212065 type:complete len:232 (+) Transcript_75882:2-697(+)
MSPSPPEGPQVRVQTRSPSRMSSGPQAPVERQRARAMSPSPPEESQARVRSQTPTQLSSGPQAPIERQRARATSPCPPEGPQVNARSKSPRGTSSGFQAPGERQQPQAPPPMAPPSSPAPLGRQPKHPGLAALLGSGARVVDRGDGTPGFQFVPHGGGIAPDGPSRTPRTSCRTSRAYWCAPPRDMALAPPPPQCQAHPCTAGALFRQMALVSPRAVAGPPQQQQNRAWAP